MAAMTEIEAIERVRSMTAASRYPTLTNHDLEMLVRAAKREDADGLAPADTGWTPTYDLNHAALRGWELKAAKVAADIDVSADGQSVSRSQALKGCETMRRFYASHMTGSAAMVLDPASVTDLSDLPTP